MPATIGNVSVKNILIDLGANIYLITLSIIKNIGDLKTKYTRLALKLAGKSIKCPSRIAKDILVKVDKFLFSMDFMVMDIDKDDEVPLIMGIHFMKTTHDY